MMIPTPKTDVAAFDLEYCGAENFSITYEYCLDGEYVDADFARRLERERNRALEALKPFLSLRTDAPNFVRDFTDACIKADEVLRTVEEAKK